MHTHRIRYEETPVGPNSAYFRGRCPCGYEHIGNGAVGNYWRDEEGTPLHRDATPRNDRVRFGVYYSDNIAR